MPLIKHFLHTKTSVFEEKLSAHLKVGDDTLNTYFTKILSKTLRSHQEQNILQTHYRMWKRFHKMKKTYGWSSCWVSEMDAYLKTIGVEFSFSTQGAQTESLNKELFAKKITFGSFLAKVPAIRRVLNLNRYEPELKTDVLTEKDLFGRLNIKKEIDPDFGPADTYYVSEDSCLTTQATPYYLKTAQENTLAYFKVFRRQTVDKTHLCEFYQLEYVRKYHGKDPCETLIADFIKIFRLLGLTNVIHVRTTRNNYTWPSYEFFTPVEDANTGSFELTEIGNSGIMDPIILCKNSTKYDPKAHYLAGAIGLERLFNIITHQKHISAAKKDFYF